MRIHQEPYEENQNPYDENMRREQENAELINGAKHGFGKLLERILIVCLVLFGIILVIGLIYGLVSPDTEDGELLAEETTLASTQPALKTQPAATTTTVSTTTTAPPQTTATSTATTQQEPAATAATTTQVENTFHHNRNFDVVDEAQYVSFGDTYIIFKVLAKSDIKINADIVLRDSNDNVVGKASDIIRLTAGQNNYFKFAFDGEFSYDSYYITSEGEEDTFFTLIGEKNAVTLKQYNTSGDHLYLTLEQTGEEVATWTQMKLLFYKNDKIVGSFESSFAILTSNLDGKGSTDVADIPITGLDFDSFEFIYQQ